MCVIIFHDFFLERKIVLTNADQNTICAIIFYDIIDLGQASVLCFKVHCALV